jgi:hypothetical protein
MQSLQLPRERVARAHILPPGDYYVVIDGLLASDTAPFSLNLDCETLLGRPTGQRMQIGDGTCGITIDADRFADGRGVWSGWLVAIRWRSHVRGAARRWRHHRHHLLHQ